MLKFFEKNWGWFLAITAIVGIASLFVMYDKVEELVETPEREYLGTEYKTLCGLHIPVQYWRTPTALYRYWFHPTIPLLKFTEETKQNGKWLFSTPGDKYKFIYYKKDICSEPEPKPKPELEKTNYEQNFRKAMFRIDI